MPTTRSCKSVSCWTSCKSRPPPPRRQRSCRRCGSTRSSLRSNELIQSAETQHLMRVERFRMRGADSAAEVGGNRPHHVRNEGAVAGELRLIALHRFDLALDGVADV